MFSFLSSSANGPVDAAFFMNMPTDISNIAQIKALPNYPSSPTFTTQLDNFDSPHDIGSYYGLRMWTYFKAPETGEYRFSVSCDDFCSLLLRTYISLSLAQSGIVLSSIYHFGPLYSNLGDFVRQSLAWHLPSR